MQNIDVLIIGAGAAGLMCAIEAAKRGRKVLIIEHANKPGKKILMSGGGRCNFTNYNIAPENYISHNPHFVKSALSRYTQWNFIALVEQYGIAYHEKVHGQLFCDHKAKDILSMLLSECEKAGAILHLKESVTNLKKTSPNHFMVETNLNQYQCESLVIASGGLSIPTLGASPFGYKIAEQFDINIWPTRAGLVPFTLHNIDKARFDSLPGISNDSLVQSPQNQFRENILFTHRGLSGPAILQISSYWTPGENITINLLPNNNLSDILTISKAENPVTGLKTILSKYFAKKLVSALLDNQTLDKKLKTLSKQEIENISQAFHQFEIKPNGTEGYRTAEVTLGGVDCNAISSKTMEAKNTKGLFFIGEVLDVSGWLGGYNFQWAWSSGWAAGQAA
tara:strand:- start:62003 stop:63184 length:1182 start_codon:yes stop_codon:yes gene_type:complete